MRRHRRDERGSIAPAMPIIAMVLLLLGGLGIDGSRELNARGEATAYAEEAARAGASAIRDTDVLQLDEGKVTSQVRTYCASVLARQEVTACRLVGILPASDADGRPLRVRVFVSTEINTTLLGMFGPHTLTASAYGEAEPYEGIRNPGDLGTLGHEGG